MICEWGRRRSETGTDRRTETEIVRVGGKAKPRNRENLKNERGRQREGRSGSDWQRQAETGRQRHSGRGKRGRETGRGR